ncbi:Alg9-like mannosyltransferase family-domain-containing protein [Chlamydoabsidia padenii]|nr:Alg9-like mannosyltransferase family-domain-containing protein [Chlamydoabsidia padenii]
MIYYLSTAGIIFRFEVGILLMILICYETLLFRRLGWWESVQCLLLASVPSLVLSVLVDSWFWQRWVWPEGVVFYFNAILNKSSEWGTLPWHAYLSQFLPRLLMISYPLAMVAFVMDSRTRRLLLPMLSYVSIFSFLPHKEWRFIIYTIPVFTAAASMAASKAWIMATTTTTTATATRSWYGHTGMKIVLVLGITGGMLLSLVSSTFLLTISQLNYPGGEALWNLHHLQQLWNGDARISVHMDVKTAMTGASRFGQLNYPTWSYSKNESHTKLDDVLEARYTHLITSTLPETFEPDFTVVGITYGLERARPRSIASYLNDVKNGSWLQLIRHPLDIDFKPSLYTLTLARPHQSWIQHTLRQHPVVLYSKTYCPYCRGAKQLLNQYCVGQQIHIVELDQLQDGAQMKDALKELSGRSTFPNLFVGGVSLGGYDDMLKMDQQGQLLADKLRMNGCLGNTS